MQYGPILMNTNKEIVREFYAQIIGRGDLSAIERLVHPDFVEHNTLPGAASGHAGLRQFVIGFHASFSEVNYVIEDLIVEHDKVAVRGVVHAVHRGVFRGVPATSRQIQWSTIHVLRLQDSLIMERWVQVDMMGLMGQIEK